MVTPQIVQFVQPCWLNTSYLWSRVLRTSHSQPTRWQQRMNKIVLPVLAAGGIFFGFPDVIAFQDVASRDAANQNNRWLAHVEEAPGETVLASVFMAGKTSLVPAIDHTITGSIPNVADRAVSRKQPIHLGVKTVRVPQKINRSLKGGRVVSATAKKPPAHFSAGSVLRRHSMLEGLNRSSKLELAFVKPKSHMEVLRVASVFHSSDETKSKINPLLPIMVANLVKESESSVFATSTQTFSVKEKFLVIISPNGGEIFFIDSTYFVAYHTPYEADIKLEFSSNSGSSWIEIATTLQTSGDGSFFWTVPNIPTTQAKIKITDTNNPSIFDESDDNFAIIPNTGGDGFIIVSSPNGEEEWEVGSQQEIKWSSTALQNVRIDVSYNGGVDFVNVVTSIAASLDSYLWTVPNNLNTQSVIRVASASKAIINDISDAPFSIVDNTAPIFTDSEGDLDYPETVNFGDSPETISSKIMDGFIIPIET